MAKPRTARLALFALLSACSSDESTAAAPEPAQVAKTAPAPAQGPAFDAATTFGTVCATCHGKSGKGDGPAGIALDPKPASFSDPSFWASRNRAHIVKVIKEGGAAVGKSPVMVGYGAQYDDGQIGELADIVMGFRPEN